MGWREIGSGEGERKGGERGQGGVRESGGARERERKRVGREGENRRQRGGVEHKEKMSCDKIKTKNPESEPPESQNQLRQLFNPELEGTKYTYSVPELQEISQVPGLPTVHKYLYFLLLTMEKHVGSGHQ